MRAAATRTAGWPALPGPRGTGPEVTVPGGPPEAAQAAGGVTLGVEEEFVLLDPSTGAAVLAGPDLVRMLDGEPGVQPEVMRFQVETATRVCTSLDDLGRDLVRLRRLAADAAASAGALLVASGIAPYGTPGLAALTDQPRYRELARRFGPLVAGAGGACGTHVHVGVPSRDLGVQVLARLRPWLAPLLAITVNSPIAGGRDTAWASCRYPAWSRWPTASVPAAWPDAAAYDTAVRRLIARGAALDEAGIYFPARLSPRHPTVEVRVADACLDAGTAVLLAGLTRALVATALAEARQGTPRGTRLVGQCGPCRLGQARARRASCRPVHRAGRRCAQRGIPPHRSRLPRAQRPRRRADDHQAAAPTRPAGHRGRPPASPLRQRRLPADVHRALAHATLSQSM
jgi:YbdK family carboxylate-amine ligase